MFGSRAALVGAALAGAAGGRMETPAVSDQAYPQPDRRRPEPLWYQVEQAIRAPSSRAANGRPATRSPPRTGSAPCSASAASPCATHCATSGAWAARARARPRHLRAQHDAGRRNPRAHQLHPRRWAPLGVVVGSRLLDCSLTRADAATAAALEIEEGEPVMRIRRLRLGNDQPIGIQTARLSGARARLPRFPACGRWSARSTRPCRGATGSCRPKRARSTAWPRSSPTMPHCSGLQPRQPGLHSRARHHRRARPVRIHPFDHARRPLRKSARRCGRAVRSQRRA